MFNLFTRLKNAWRGFTRNTYCCECVEQFDETYNRLVSECEDLTDQVNNLKLENANLKRELEFLE